MATDPISENSGFRMFDIWDLGALQFLSLIAKASADSQTVWSDNSITTVSSPTTGEANAKIITKGTAAAPAVWVDDLWQSQSYLIGKLEFPTHDSMTLTSPDTNNAVSFGTADTSSYTPPVNTSGWIRDVLDCPFVIGDDTHDLMEIFLPKTLVATEAQATFADKYVSTLNARYPITGYGGTPSSVKELGLFFMDRAESGACRLAKS